MTTAGCMLVCDCRAADSADSVLVEHLVTNQLLTAAQGSSCHPYWAGHSRTRVTPWSSWASGPLGAERGWEARGEQTLCPCRKGLWETLVSQLLVPGEGQRGLICPLAPAQPEIGWLWMLVSP